MSTIPAPGASTLGIDPQLLEILVCPWTKGPLDDRYNQELVSRTANLPARFEPAFRSCFRKRRAGSDKLVVGNDNGIQMQSLKTTASQALIQAKIANSDIQFCRRLATNTNQPPCQSKL